MTWRAISVRPYTKGGERLSNMELIGQRLFTGYGWADIARHVIDTGFLFDWHPMTWRAISARPYHRARGSGAGRARVPPPIVSPHAGQA